MNAIATRTETRCPTGIDVARTAGGLVGAYGADAALIARKWAAVALFCGDAARARDWRDIVADVERRIVGDTPCEAACQRPAIRV